MQIETLKIYCDVAETESFSKAALMNHITQSAVSQQVRALEKRYQALLIERGKKNFSLTPEGRVFLQASRSILDTYHSLSDRIHELQNVVAGELKIATVYSIGLHELPPYLKYFKKQFPDVNVKIEYRRSAQVYSEVQEGNVDVGLVAFPVKRKGLTIEPFCSDKLILICAPDHPLAAKHKVKLRNLQGEKFISFEPDLPTRKAIDRMLKSGKVDIEPVMEFDNIETVKRAVEIETGVSIVPETTVRDECESGTLCGIEIEGPDMWRPLGILLKRNRGTSPAQKQFIQLLQEGDFLGASLQRKPVPAPKKAAKAAAVSA